MKASILAWKLGKGMLAVAIISVVVYFSLKQRVEQEHGPGSWEEWLRATPDVEEKTFHASAEPPTKPRNMKARFWTGVPRIRDSSVTRLDRHGYSLGYSKSKKRPAWFSTYLTGQSASTPMPAKTSGKWIEDPTIESSEAGSSGPSSTRGMTSCHFIPPSLMEQSYGWGEDAWYKSNKLTSPQDFCQLTWKDLTQLAEKYAKIYRGLVIYVIPLYEDHPTIPSSVALVMVRPSPKGPVATTMMVESSQTGTEPSQNMSGLLHSLTDVEERSGVYLFADLPSAWREYLLHPSQNTLWPTGDM